MYGMIVQELRERKVGEEEEKKKKQIIPIVYHGK
jgi:hypothetical protein